MKKTKIVCTIGPSSDNLGLLHRMVKAGMSAARLNFSHGDHDSHGRIIKKLKTLSGIPIIADMKGPKIRTGETKTVELKEGQEFVLTTREIVGDNNRITVSYHKLPQKVKKGDIIFLDDGKIGLRVKKTTKKEIYCQVKDDGILSSRRGVNVPGIDVGTEVPTKKDVADIKFVCREGVDFIALSQVKSAKEVERVRKLLGRNNGIKIISKIEHGKAVENLDEIIKVSDGVMVARGDLGVEIPLFKVPLLQKEIILKCNVAAKPVIVATQMLLSMINNKKPTRAEVSDVANAVLDGTDAVMLSEETASGKYPLLALKAMGSIIYHTKSSMSDVVPHVIKTKSTNVSAVIAKNVWQSSRELPIKCIVTHTKSGFTARNISKFKPKIPIYAFTSDEKISRQLNLSWGVKSFLVKREENLDDLLSTSVQCGLEHNLFKREDRIIVTAGLPLYTSGTTNFMEIQRAGKFLRKRQ